MSLRYRVIAICFLLAGCAGISEQPALQQPPPPDSDVVSRGLTSSAEEAKLPDPLLASPIRVASPLAPGSPGVYIACVRSSAVAPNKSTYAVFFKDNKYNASRLALDPDNCDLESFRPFTRMAQPKKPPA